MTNLLIKKKISVHHSYEIEFNIEHELHFILYKQE